MSENLVEQLGEFQTELEKLRNASYEITKAGKIANESVELTGRMLETFKGFVEPTNKLIEKVEKVDFPLRLEKLDIAVTSINSSLNTSIQRIDNIERELKERLDHKTIELKEKIESNSKELKDVIIKLEEKQRNNFKLMTIINCAILIMTVVILLLR